MSKKTITVEPEYHKLFKDLMDEYKFNSQSDYFKAMVLYFKETGINPQAKNRSTAAELSKLRNTVIGFIRNQEKTKLDPLIIKINDTFEYLLTYFKNEAPTKSDLKNLILSSSDIRNSDSDISNENEKYVNLLNHVQTTFSEFLKNFKTSTFGGYTIEKNIFENYKNVFDNLK